MKFGPVPETELNSIDFTLTGDPVFNKAGLPGKKVNNPKVYLGCAKWGETEWISRLQYWLDNGLEELYFLMHMHDEAFSPEPTVYMVDKLNAACGLKLTKPVFVEQQLLF